GGEAGAGGSGAEAGAPLSGPSCPPRAAGLPHTEGALAGSSGSVGFSSGAGARRSRGADSPGCHGCCGCCGAGAGAPLSGPSCPPRAAASEPGSRDRRDAMTVAMELLAEELGAKPL
ncbi:hypothetical protein ACUY2R_11410, partial [Corynebacterium mastitidis]